MGSELNARVHRHSVDLLRSVAVRIRRVHRFVIGSGGLIIGIGEIGTNLVADPVKPYFGSLWVLGLVLVFAGLWLEPDQAAADILATAHDASKKAAELEAERDDLLLLSDALEDQIGLASTLYETHRALTQAVQAIVAQGLSAGELDGACARLLDIVVERRWKLCEIGEEKWNFAVYLHDQERGDLRCVACRRWSRESEEQQHRRWAPGKGHTGSAFERRRELVCADANDPSVAGLIQGTPDQLRDYDSSVYVSIASIPITATADAQPFGILVATSDRVARFTADGGEGRDTVEPLRALANALATLLTMNRLQDSTQSDSERAGR